MLNFIREPYIYTLPTLSSPLALAVQISLFHTVIVKDFICEDEVQ